ncbi:MAG TPA: spherulation-specific family 4 protein, partial [Polyangiaceae bacterium]
SAASIVPIGYVSTSYTARGEPTVKGDVDRWRSQYPAVQGIFFDEQSSKAGDEQFYRDVSQYAKAQGFVLTVGNPGSDVPSSFLDTVDVMLAYESSGTPPLASLTKYAAERTHYGIIPYGAALDTAYAKSASSSVAYVFITDDTLPNPWDTLPGSFESLLNALEP